jgi:hypothetical protein
MSLIARHSQAEFVLEKLKARLEQRVDFDRNSTAFDMGVDQERRDLLTVIKHYENQSRQST